MCVCSVQCAVSRVQCVCGVCVVWGKAEVEYVCCVVLVCAVLDSVSVVVCSVSV